MEIRKTASAYFALQGIGVIGWWLVLWFEPRSRAYFRLGANDDTLLAFWLPDFALLAAGSFVVSGLCRFGSTSQLVPALWFVVGNLAYATLYCLSYALSYDSGWLGVTLMSPALIASGNFAVGLTPALTDGMFRRGNDDSTGRILAKTFAQIVVVWTLILIVFPALIVQVESRLSAPQFDFPFQRPLAAVLFCVISVLGVAAAVTMAKLGRGTPLPMDTAPRLVVSGIYAYVRNPMAISGIGQGLAVGVFLGSPLVMIYAIFGGLIWQTIFRPLEESDLLKTFGADYDEYRRNVSCWIPRRFPFRPGGVPRDDRA